MAPVCCLLCSSDEQSDSIINKVGGEPATELCSWSTLKRLSQKGTLLFVFDSYCIQKFLIVMNDEAHDLVIEAADAKL